MVQTQLELQKLTAGLPTMAFSKGLRLPLVGFYNAFKFLELGYPRNNSQTWGANCSKPIFLPENLSKMEQSCRNV